MNKYAIFKIDEFTSLLADSTFDDGKAYKIIK